MSLISKVKKHIVERKEIKNQKCNTLIENISVVVDPISAMLNNNDDFIDPVFASNWQTSNSDLYNQFRVEKINSLKKTNNYNNLIKYIQLLGNYYTNLNYLVKEHNEYVTNSKITDCYKIIGDVEGRTLDNQQMLAIVKDAHNHLIIAGAGTGKTTTVVGKIKYLLKSGKYKPEDILVLSFTNASASEMSERINAETGYNIDASTFHKLGLNIIKKVEGKPPKISNIDLNDFVKTELEKNLKDNIYFKELVNYMIYNHIHVKSEFEFKSKAEYDEYLKLNPPTTLSNKVVKSYGEMQIANFFIQNGINYCYEQAYKIDTRDSEYSQYYPDFYLPDYDIYIEYFGINSKGEVPSYFTGKNGLTPTETYQKSMEWKRELHKQNNTKLIECFAYEKFDGTLLSNLEQKLIDNKVKFNPVDTKTLWNKIAQDKMNVLNIIAQLFATIITLIKSNDYDIEKLTNINSNTTKSVNNERVIRLVSPIFNAYCDYLKHNNEIDFNDMINLANRYVREGKFVNPYKYVIVDEYQDISKARFQLLESLRISNYYDLFCVGDDWQSIYRFAGSDIGYILNFEKYWGATEINKIETTYRFTQKLIEISSNFVMRNPMQIKKYIRGNSNFNGFALGEINGYTEKLAIEFMLNKINDLPKNSSVYFIGRYLFDGKLLNDNSNFNLKYDNQSGLTNVYYPKRPDLKMQFLTAHKSKGLQADYVFIINNKRNGLGFPSKIEDAPILSLLLENSEHFPQSEERRLFYVSLTRAKKKAFVVTVNGNESEFVQELRANYGEELKKEKYECLWCGGKLVKKTGPYGTFLGCSNYRTEGCTYKRKIKL